MANDMMDMLKGILGNDAEEKIKTVMSSLGVNENNQPQTPSNTDTEVGSQIATTQPTTSMPAINTDAIAGMMKIKNMFDEMTNGKNDTRSNLLMSLKPYMRSSRQKSIDNAVRIIGLTKLTDLFR